MTGRVAANGKLRKQNQASPGSLSLMREVNDFACVAGEVSDRGIDLAQRYLHSSSVKRREQHAKSSWRSAGICRVSCGRPARTHRIASSVRGSGFRDQGLSGEALERGRLPACFREKSDRALRLAVAGWG